MSVIAPDFPHHWKTTLLEQELGEPNAGMYVVRLWLHCHARMEDCFAMTAEQLAAVCKFPVKEARRLEKVLCECRWLRRQGKKVQVLGWREYNARLFANQRNGKLGGRPRANPTQPNGRPLQTDGFPLANPSKTEWSGKEGSRVDNRLSGADQRDSLVCSIRDDLCALFSRKKRLGGEAMRALQELADQGELPLAESDWSALSRFYQEKKNQPGADDAHWRMTADAVALNLLSEIDKAKGWLAKHDIPFGSERTTPAADPDGWREWLVTRGFPSVAYAEADRTLRDEFRCWRTAGGSAPLEPEKNEGEAAA